MTKHITIIFVMVLTACSSHKTIINNISEQKYQSLMCNLQSCTIDSMHRENIEKADWYLKIKTEHSQCVFQDTDDYSYEYIGSIAKTKTYILKYEDYNNTDYMLVDYNCNKQIDLFANLIISKDATYIISYDIPNQDTYRGVVIYRFTGGVYSLIAHIQPLNCYLLDIGFIAKNQFVIQAIENDSDSYKYYRISLPD